MPQQVRIEGSAAEATIFTGEMQPGKIYVVADSAGNGSTWPIGALAVRASSYVIRVDPAHDVVASTNRTAGMKVRDLRPGESITIAGA